MIEIVSAEYVEGCKVRLQFSNGESGVVDLEAFLWGPVFEPLKTPSSFKRFRVSDVLHTISWDNDADFAPEFLHDKMLEQAHAAGTTSPSR